MRLLTAMNECRPERSASILGAGGFIGSHLCEFLLDRGWDIDAWDLDSHRLESLLDRTDFRFHLGDLRSSKERHASTSASVVINLAALCQPAQYVSNPRRTIEDNYDLSRGIALACLESGARLLQFSTCEVYGRTLASFLPPLSEPTPDQWILREDETPLILEPSDVHRWSYACAKQLTERYLLALAKEDGLAVTIVRPFNFIGPWMDFLPGRDGTGTPRVLASFLAHLLDDSPLPLVDAGRNFRTFCSIHDALRAIEAMLERPSVCEGQIFNVGNPANERDIRSFAEELKRSFARVTGTSAWLEHPVCEVSAQEFYGQGYGDSDRRVPCIDKAQQLLDWRPRVGLNDALDEISAWALQHYSMTRMQ